MPVATDGGTSTEDIQVFEKEQARKKRGQGRNRKDNLQNYWKSKLPSHHFEGYDFRATLIRREKHGATRVLSLDRVMNTISWTEDSPILKASVSLMNPHADVPLPVKEGFEVKVDWSVRGKGRWHNLFRNRIETVGETGTSGEVELPLVDEMQWFAKSKEDFSFKKAKKNRPRSGKRTKGWRADQIAREVCRRVGIPVGKLAKGKHLIENLTEEGVSPLSVIVKAYKLDRDETGRRFVISMRNGRLNVVQLRRSPDLLLVGEHLIEATLQKSLKGSFATLVNLTATAKREKGTKKKKKIEVEVKSSPAIMSRYGRIRTEWSLDDPVASKAVARAKAKRKLAASQEPKRELTMTLPGLPTLKRGDALKVKIDQFGLYELIYVASVTHTVDGSGNYTMEVTATFEDPFEDEKGDEIRKKLCKKARKRGRKVPSFCDKGYDPAAPLPRNRKARNRRDRPQSQDSHGKARR
jgi:hypothetical protein